MGLEAVGALAVFAATILVAHRLISPTVQTIGGLFQAPDLGWPSGVQEDDDFHWSWVKDGQRIVSERASMPEADWHEIDPASVRLPVQPLLRRPRG
jgi:hypothetical protein